MAPNAPFPEISSTLWRDVLFPSIVAHLSKGDCLSFRLLCSGARDSHDWQAACLSLRDSCHRSAELNQTPCIYAVHAVLRILGRGCQPDVFKIELREGLLEDRHKALLGFLGTLVPTTHGGGSTANPAPTLQTSGRTPALQHALDPIPATQLRICSPLLSSQIASGLRAALPYLRSVCLHPEKGVLKASEVEGLAALLCSPPAAASGVAAGDASAAGVSSVGRSITTGASGAAASGSGHSSGGIGPGPRIESLELESLRCKPLPEGLVQALRGCSSLRRLRFSCRRDRYLSLDGLDGAGAAALGGLTQLTCLVLETQPSAAFLLARMLRPLTRLEKLKIANRALMDEHVVPMRLFAGLTRLRSLSLPRMALQLEGPTGGLEALPYLTKLVLADLAAPLGLQFPADGGEGFGVGGGGGGGGGGDGAAPPALPRLLLPPALASLRLELAHQHDVCLLGCLEAPPSLARLETGGELEEADVLTIDRELLATPDGRLTPAGEEALLRTFRLMRRYRLFSLSLTLRGGQEDDHPPLRPAAVGVAAAGGGVQGVWEGGLGEEAPETAGGSASLPGSPSHHGRCLAALGRCDVLSLQLSGFELAACDLHTIATHMGSVWALCLHGCTFPPESLPALAGLSGLSKLDLDLTPWLLTHEQQQQQQQQVQQVQQRQQQREHHEAGPLRSRSQDMEVDGETEAAATGGAATAGGGATGGAAACLAALVRAAVPALCAALPRLQVTLRADSYNDAWEREAAPPTTKKRGSCNGQVARNEGSGGATALSRAIRITRAVMRPPPIPESVRVMLWHLREANAGLAEAQLPRVKLGGWGGYTDDWILA